MLYLNNTLSSMRQDDFIGIICGIQFQHDIRSCVFDVPICPPDAPVISWHDHDPVTWEIMLIIPPLRCSVSSSRPWASWHHFSSGYLRSVQHVRCPAQTLHIRAGNEPSRSLKFHNHGEACKVLLVPSPLYWLKVPTNRMRQRPNITSTYHGLMAF